MARAKGGCEEVPHGDRTRVSVSQTPCLTHHCNRLTSGNAISSVEYHRRLAIAKPGYDTRHAAIIRLVGGAETCLVVEDNDCSWRCALQHFELLRNIRPRQDEISGYDHIAFEESRRAYSSGLLSIKGCTYSLLI
jgi:hypothetical protein